MRFTKKDRAIAVSLLNRVYWRLSTRSREYICTTLSEVAETEKEISVSLKLQDLIAYRLSGGDSFYPSLESWLRGVHGHSFYLTEMNEGEWISKVQETRLRWLDSLIKEFEA